MKKVLSILLLFIILVSGNISLASSTGLPEKSIFSDNTIIHGISEHSPDRGFSFFKDGTVTSLSIADLFGSNKGYLTYTGEVSNQCYEENKDGLENVKREDKSRDTWEDPKAGCSSEGKDQDLHVTALFRDTSFWSNILTIVITAIFQFVNYITTMVINVMFEIRGINIEDVSKAFGESFYNTMNTIFLFGTNNNGELRISPFLLICVISGMVGVVITAIRALSGTRSGRELWQDIGRIILSIIVVGMALGSVSMAGKLTGSVANLVNKVETEMIQSMGNEFSLFVTEGTTNEDRDIISTQKGLVQKTIIDSTISVQFGGYSIDDLDMDKNDWGGIDIPDKYRSKIWVTNRKDSDGTYKDAEGYSNNLGYYLWAIRSKINPNKPFITDSNGRVEINRTQESPSVAIDFIDYIYKKAKEKGDKSTETKAYVIMNSFSVVDPGVSALNSLLVSLQLIALAYIFSKIVLDLIIGKVGVIFSIFTFPIAGPLMLVKSPKAQEFSNNLILMFVASFFRITIYSILFDTILTTVAVVNRIQLGAIVGIGLILIFDRFGLKKIREIFEEMMSKMQPEFMNNGIKKAREFAGYGSNKIKKMKEDKAKEKLEEMKNVVFDKKTNEAKLNKDGSVMRYGQTWKGKLEAAAAIATLGLDPAIKSAESFGKIVQEDKERAKEEKETKEFDNINQRFDKEVDKEVGKFFDKGDVENFKGFKVDKEKDPTGVLTNAAKTISRSDSKIEKIKSEIDNAKYSNLDNFLISEEDKNLLKKAIGEKGKNETIQEYNKKIVDAANAHDYLSEKGEKIIQDIETKNNLNERVENNRKSKENFMNNLRDISKENVIKSESKEVKSIMSDFDKTVSNMNKREQKNLKTNKQIQDFNKKKEEKTGEVGRLKKLMVNKKEPSEPNKIKMKEDNIDKDLKGMI